MKRWQDLVVALCAASVTVACWLVPASLHGLLCGLLLALVILSIFSKRTAALLLARRVIRPLRDLSSAAEAISGGELRQRLPVSGADEVAVMARAFNRMSERIADTVDELASADPEPLSRPRRPLPGR